jgi:uracil-DNA glycosylase family 4
MSQYEAVHPVTVAPGSRGKGRPSAGAAHATTPLYNFPGPTKMDQLGQLYDDWYNCQRCILGQSKGTMMENSGEDIVFFDGNPDADILIIGEAPGEHEDTQKRTFVGPSGQLLNMILAKYTSDPDMREAYEEFAGHRRSERSTAAFQTKALEWRDREFAITNVISCRPPENRTPVLPEIKACYERLWNIIYIVDPLLIVACGNVALSTVTRKTAAQVTKHRGQVFDVTYHGKYGDLTYPVIPVFHPSYLGRMADWKTEGGTWTKTEEDWKKAFKLVDFLRYHHKGIPFPDREHR